MMAKVPAATASVAQWISPSFPIDLDRCAGMMPDSMDRKAEDLVGLPENDRERDAIEKADQDRPREEVRQPAETQKACPDADAGR